jgi:hypothetical protein
VEEQVLLSKELLEFRFDNIVR